jgi:hypothetical protein
LQQFNESVANKVGVLPIVETPRHLLQVGGEMLYRDLMTRSHNAMLKSENADSIAFVALERTAGGGCPYICTLPSWPIESRAGAPALHFVK